MTTSTITKSRKTKETEISLEVSFSGSQNISINTGLPFFDHMLEQLASHGRWDLTLSAKGDIEVDDHHLVEDVAIVLGQALQEYWRDLPGMQRYGQRLLPMDETLMMCGVDLSGRPMAVVDLPFTRETLGGINTEMWEHFFLSLAMAAQITLHLKTQYFKNNHHLVESSFKALAYALREALTPTSDSNTTKGVL